MAKSTEEVAKEWDEYAEGWTTGEMGKCVLEFNQLAEEVVRSKVGDLSGKSVMEFGAGHGVLGLALAPESASVALVDVAPKMIEEAKKKIDSKGFKNVTAHCCDVLVECPFSPDSLDLIISGSVLTFTPDLPKTLAKLADLSKPGSYQLHMVFKGKEDAPVRGRSRTTELGYEDGMSEAQLRDELAAAKLSCLEVGELSPPSMEGSMTWIWALAKK
ncbi:dauC [Symbiodinium natans]|uniref:DauC protein n=1 Tax=Symbiodinium natans TaxID=878477 RepID=A0A812MGF8_9DINO|nr:dauC [Symbiodinium natans]